MSAASSTPRRYWLRGWVALGLVLAVAAAVLIYLYRGPLWEYTLYYWQYVSTKEKIKALLTGSGKWAPLIFMGLQILQVVFAPIPGEATGFLGGFLFGVPLGMLYSTVGLTVGSILAFLLGRWLEIHFVARVVDRETMKKFDFLMDRQGVLISFLLFLIPGFPKDYLCFILGVSPMHFRIFLLISTIGRLPGTLMLTLQGAKVYNGDYLEFGILLGAILILGLGLMYFREGLYQWLRRWGHCQYDRNNQVKK